MRLYDRVADLPLDVASVTYERRERDTSSDFTRVTTTVELHGRNAVGRGEDVTYETADHDPYPDPDIVGDYELHGFAATLDAVDLWPEAPSREDFRHYRRWAFESAALDLALKQADADFAGVLGRERSAVRFVASTRVEDFSRIEALRSANPEVEFKLDPTPDWTDDLIDRLADTDRVRVLDFKGLYEGTDVDTEPDPDLYWRIIDAFPDAVLEDPALTDEIRPLFDGEEGRVSWDYPITDVASVQDRPWVPDWLNVKPSRFGTVAEVLDTVDYCEAEGIRMYGGGQFELGVGREQIQTLASVFYADSPNDVAPGAYNDPDPSSDLPRSPLSTDDDLVGFSF